MTDSRELAGKVAFVTGAGRLRGIGRETALVLARMGADIVVTGTGRNPSTFPDDEKKVKWRDIESVADEIRAIGRRALPIVLDVADETQVARAVAKTVAEFGRLDILINNAAAPYGKDRVAVVDVEPAVAALASNFHCPRSTDQERGSLAQNHFLRRKCTISTSATSAIKPSAIG